MTQDTLMNHGKSTAGLRLNTDKYEISKINNLYKRVVPGGVIIKRLLSPEWTKRSNR